MAVDTSTRFCDPERGDLCPEGAKLALEYEQTRGAYFRGFSRSCTHHDVRQARSAFWGHLEDCRVAREQEEGREGEVEG